MKKKDMKIALHDVFDEYEPVEVILSVKGGQVYVYVPLLETEEYDGLIAVIEQCEKDVQVCMYDAESEDPRRIERWEVLPNACKKC